MQIPKDQVVRLLRARGEDQRADEAASRLPDSVDTDQDADLLESLGVERKDLISTLGSGGDVGDVG